MKIGRFLDDQGQAALGIPQADGKHAEILRGDVLAYPEATGEIRTVSRWLAPLQPCNIYCIGLNYRDHAAETGAKLPDKPVIFMKPTSTVIATQEIIRLPSACQHGPEVDYEAELAVVIGKAGKNIPLSRALDHVYGYTCANDVSARRWQKHGGAGQWIRAKSFDTFCPLGPVLVTRDEIPDPQSLSIGCSLNSQVVQQGSSADMIFPVAELIEYLSRDTTLLAGTVLLTGTPAGVGYTRTPPLFLKSGDTTRVEIDKIGVLANTVEAA